MSKSSDQQKQLKKLRNKESARRSRAKKKQEFSLLYQENESLKLENAFLKTKLHSLLCKSCKDKLTQTLNELTNQEPTNFSIKHNTISYTENKKQVMMFTTFIVILCVLGSVIEHTCEYVNKSPIQRKLKTMRTFDSFEVNVNQLNVNTEGFFITLGDYYTLTKEHPFLENAKFMVENKGNVRIVNEKDVLFYRNSSCENCVVRLRNETIVSDGKSMTFSLILKRGSMEGEDVKEKEEFGYEIKCEVIGVKVFRVRRD